MGYLKVKENEDSEIVEIPTEEDGTLSLEVLQNMYAGVTGLKYNIDGHTRLLKVSDGKILAPSEGWDSSPIYYCVYPKVSDGKRKAEDEEHHVSKSNKSNQNSDAKNNWTSTDLVVLGLAWKTTDKELNDYFSKFGELQFVQVKTDPVTKKSRGFGFIRFLDNEVQVRVMLQRHEIDGRWCDVRVSQSKDILSKKVSSKIFIGQCTEEMTEDDFRDHFVKFGEISDIFVPKPFRGFAFVTFVDPESAQTACRQQHYIRDKKVLVTEAIPKNAKELNRGGGRSTRNVRSAPRSSRDDGYYRDRYSGDYGRREDKSWRSESRYTGDWYSSGGGGGGGSAGMSSRSATWSRRSPTTWREKTPTDNNINSDLVAKVVNKAVMGVIENLKVQPQVTEPQDRDSWWSRR